MELSADTRIQNYRIVRLLGKGGMGEVYLAEDTQLGRRVAIKVLPPEYVADPARRKRFALEARAASQLSHPHSAHVYGYGEWEGGAYLAIEFVEGETLTARLRKGACPWEEVARVGEQVAGVLQAAHEKGIVHRDVKSPNIMITPDGQAKLLDFGLAKFEERGERADGESETQTVLTAVGSVIGSIEYMSPEQAMGRTVDGRSDLFSLGVVLYEMAAGRRPFGGPNAAAVLGKILGETAEPLAARNRSTPAELERIIGKCLEKKPEMRYPSALELGNDLRALQRGGTGKAAAGRSRRSWVMATGGAGAALAGLGIYRYVGARRAASIAVLPFENEGLPEDEALSDGLTEGLIEQMAAEGTIRVIARSAVFRFKEIGNPLEVVRQLRAETMLTGRMKRAADTVRVTAELADAGTAQLLWSQQFTASLSGLQGLPGELAGLVLRALGIRRRKSRGRVAEGEAYEAYLRGRHALNRREPNAFVKAQEWFQKANDLDPLYAAPYAGLADVYSLQSGGRPPNDVCPKAKAAAKRALELEPGLAEGHTTLGFVQMHYDLAWDEAERSLQRGLQLNPSYAPAHSYYARWLTARGRFAEAATEQRRAMELDPLSPALGTALGITLYHGRRWVEAEREMRRVLADQPKFIQAQAMLGVVLLGRKEYAGAIGELEKCLRMIGEDDYGVVADWALAQALAGNREKAQEGLRRVERLAEKEYVAPCFLAGPLLGLGERERALEMLEKSVDPDRSWPVFYYGVEPKLDPVRGEPRFRKLLERTGLATVQRG
jgi:serine/threonine-protein kinase